MSYLIDTVTLFFVVLFSVFLFFFHHPLLDSVVQLSPHEKRLVVQLSPP